MNEALKKRLISSLIYAGMYSLLYIPVSYFVDGYVEFDHIPLRLLLCFVIAFLVDFLFSNLKSKE